MPAGGTQAQDGPGPGLPGGPGRRGRRVVSTPSGRHRTLGAAGRQNSLRQTQDTSSCS